MRMSTSIVLLYGIILISVVCFLWITSKLSSSVGSMPSRNREFIPASSSTAMTKAGLEDDITWIGSVWIPSPRMIMYSTQEIQHILSRYDSILWLGDKVSPFATLFNLLVFDNTTAYLSRRQANDEKIALKSTAPCPTWMSQSTNLTSSQTVCHSIVKEQLRQRQTQTHHKSTTPPPRQNVDFVTTSCWFHVQKVLVDWYSSLQQQSAPSLYDHNHQNRNILVVLALGCSEVSHNARRRRACETPHTRRFPKGVWQRMDEVFQQLKQFMIIESSATKAPHSITVVWRLGNYCHAHPERDGLVLETDRRLQQGILSLPLKTEPYTISRTWDLVPLDHGRAIRGTVHSLNADTRLEHNLVFLQLLANYLEQH